MSWPTPKPEQPIVCGHRGAPVAAAENTLESFEKALELGATWIEFDVRPTADGQLVIHHDPVTSEGVHVASAPRSALRSDIPALGELAEQFPTLGFDVELKTDDIDMSADAYVAIVLDALSSHCTEVPGLIVTSFDAEVLALVADQRPELPTGLLHWKQPIEWLIETALQDGHVAIAPGIGKLTAELAAEAQGHGLGILTWTVNTPEQVRFASSLGVDMIIGDDPSVIVAHR